MTGTLGCCKIIKKVPNKESATGNYLNILRNGGQKHSASLARRGWVPRILVYWLLLRFFLLSSGSERTFVELRMAAQHS